MLPMQTRTTMLTMRDTDHASNSDFKRTQPEGLGPVDNEMDISQKILANINVQRHSEMLARNISGFGRPKNIMKNEIMITSISRKKLGSVCMSENAKAPALQTPQIQKVSPFLSQMDFNSSQPNFKRDAAGIEKKEEVISVSPMANSVNVENMKRQIQEKRRSLKT